MVVLKRTDGAVVFLPLLFFPQTVKRLLMLPSQFSMKFSRFWSELEAVLTIPRGVTEFSVFQLHISTSIKVNNVETLKLKNRM